MEWMKLRRTPLQWIGIFVYVIPFILALLYKASSFFGIKMYLTFFLRLSDFSFFVPFIAATFIFTREYQESN
jgi:hypothetical protein